MSLFELPPRLVKRFRSDLEAAAGDVPERIGVAVSGGPDSLALLLLASAALPGRVAAATVDHGLRSESAGEAAEVARICRLLGVAHRTLPSRVERAGEGLQAAARQARYAALAQWMEGEGLGLLLTGHHCDDQAETLLMRLNRGSGVAGLAGVRSAAPVPGQPRSLRRVCRPLLSWRRVELAGVVDAAGLEAAHDPSNADPAFDRARLRRAISDADWLDPSALARSAGWLADAEEALGWAADRLAGERVGTEEGAVTLGPQGLPAELLRRLVLDCLARVEPAARPRGEAVGRLIAALESGRTATLAGVRAWAVEGLWRFERAPPRRP